MEPSSRPGDVLETLLLTVLPQLKSYLNDNLLPDAKVVRFTPPAELLKLLPPLPTSASLPSSDSSSSSSSASPPATSASTSPALPSLASLQSIVGVILRYSTATSHPLFLDKLYTAPDPLGHVSELLTSLLNTNTHVYAASPVFSMMERQLVSLIATQYLRFPADRHDGLVCPGGSYSNLMSMLVARHLHFPHVKEEGWKGTERPVAFTSASAHYSLRKAANALGIGQRSVRAVPVDRHGRMDTEALRRMLSASLAAGEHPFYICSTAGTTTLGAFDPIISVSSVISPARLYHHVDASWGGAVLFNSARRQQLLAGIDSCDSVTFNPHKLLGIPLQCSLLIVRQPQSVLTAVCSTDADYLFHAHADSEYDIGTKTLQCGRHNDVLKLWLTWHLKSDLHFLHIVNQTYHRTELMVKLIRDDRRFSLLSCSPISNVCFWYLPAEVREAWHRDVEPVLRLSVTGVENSQLPDLSESLMRGFLPAMEDIPARVYRAMQLDGRLLVNFAHLRDEGHLQLPSFFRIVLHNPLTTAEHLRRVLELIDELATGIDFSRNGHV